MISEHINNIVCARYEYDIIKSTGKLRFARAPMKTYLFIKAARRC